MGNLSSALQQLRAERTQAQLQVEKLGQAIAVIARSARLWTHSLRRGIRADSYPGEVTREIRSAARASEIVDRNVRTQRAG
jgi:hypothetical protein